MADANASSSSTPLRRTGEQRRSDSPDTGADDGSAKREISRRRIEDLLHEHLRRLWVAPAEEFARLQIARLDAMILKLIGRIQDGDLEAMDRTLMIINSLDRLPGFIKARRDEPYTEEARARLLQKLYDAAARLQSEPPVE
jgi:hypothetical protein